MIQFIIGVLLFLLVLLLFFYFKEKHRQKLLFMHLEDLLRQARDGDFSVENYDESLLSRFEADFSQYLNAKEIEEQKIENERDQIKNLISDISHQTKTPIANLSLYSELLEEENLTDQAHAYSQSIRQQIDKLNHLIQMLVKLSRLESGMIQLNVQPHSVANLLDDLVNDFSLQAHHKGKTIVQDYTEDQALFDYKWTMEAMGNLIDNALKYSTGPDIRLTSESLGMFVRIQVIDQGPGIAENERNLIFQRFYRSKMSQNEDGLGIGLNLSREIIRLQHGVIKVDETPAGGSVFNILLVKSE
ncbi:HAMP domain-containing histidine kinase [Facklamia sp. DSM 111018]|uniref:histidine kinase n=1 Tax=Facklamia lactis TaxID=2749967 RepID=A0ABS0LN96_9LACT|nr:HAMP domain-containing sensor histidine kinase [Facklamia lactis]MBG9985583.1 HAMP domain-containing histidine kinase [Facklamia lactis]